MLWGEGTGDRHSKIYHIFWNRVPYLLDQMLRLLFTSSPNFMGCLFESGAYWYHWTWASSPDHSNIFNVHSTLQTKQRNVIPSLTSRKVMNSERTNLFLTTAIKPYAVSVHEPRKPHPMRFVDVCTCYSSSKYSRVATLSFSAPGGAASIREQQLIESGVWSSEYSIEWKEI